MVNLQFSEEEFAKEMKVIMEERRMRTDDDPHAQLHEQLMASGLYGASIPHAGDRLDERPAEHAACGRPGLVRKMVRAEQRHTGGVR